MLRLRCSQRWRQPSPTAEPVVGRSWTTSPSRTGCGSPSSGGAATAWAASGDWKPARAVDAAKHFGWRLATSD